MLPKLNGQLLDPHSFSALPLHNNIFTALHSSIWCNFHCIIKGAKRVMRGPLNQGLEQD